MSILQPLSTMNCTSTLSSHGLVEDYDNYNINNTSNYKSNKRMAPPIHLIDYNSFHMAVHDDNTSTTNQDNQSSDLTNNYSEITNSIELLNDLNNPSFVKNNLLKSMIFSPLTSTSFSSSTSLQTSVICSNINLVSNNSILTNQHCMTLNESNIDLDVVDNKNCKTIKDSLDNQNCIDCNFLFMSNPYSTNLQRSINSTNRMDQINLKNINNISTSLSDSMETNTTNKTMDKETFDLIDNYFEISKSNDSLTFGAPNLIKSDLNLNNLFEHLYQTLFSKKGKICLIFNYFWFNMMVKKIILKI